MTILQKSMLLGFLGFTFLTACKTIPKNLAAVSPFEKERYLGDWYEIARIDSRFEKNLIYTTASYSMKKDGNIEVLNRGFDTISKQWTQVTGKAKFVKSDTIAMLKVSFFGPFYGGYNVIALDEDYRYALVSGANRNYLWILSREKSIPDSIKNDYVALAHSLGFNVTSLLWVEQK